MGHAAARFDAPFWTILVLGVLAVGSFGCFGVAFAASSTGTSAPVFVTSI